MIYSATLPSYDNYKNDKKGEKNETVVNANDPKNKDEVLAILRGYKF